MSQINCYCFKIPQSVVFCYRSTKWSKRVLVGSTISVQNQHSLLFWHLSTSLLSLTGLALTEGLMCSVPQMQVSRNTQMTTAWSAHVGGWKQDSTIKNINAGSSVPVPEILHKPPVSINTCQMTFCLSFIVSCNIALNSMRCYNKRDIPAILLLRIYIRFNFLNFIAHSFIQ